jgi:hypothetical protein
VLCVKVLAGIAQNGESESARVAAAIILLDRGRGKPPTTHTGPDGQGDIRVTIRHIANGCGKEFMSSKPTPQEGDTVKSAAFRAVSELTH